MGVSDCRRLFVFVYVLPMMALSRASFREGQADDARRRSAVRMKTGMLSVRGLALRRGMRVSMGRRPRRTVLRLKWQKL
jgi:hypothetical protein